MSFPAEAEVGLAEAEVGLVNDIEWATLYQYVY